MISVALRTCCIAFSRSETSRVGLDVAEHDPVDDVADEQADVVQRVVQLVRDAGRQLAERRQLGGLHELLLLVAQLLLAPLDGLRGLTQVAHDVDHRLAAVAQPLVGLVRVLEDAQEGPAGVVQPLGVLGQAASVVLVVGEDVEHRLALLAELPVRLVQVAHDVQQRAAALLALVNREAGGPRPAA